jgi:farnesyl diphosphate synthase
MRVCGIPDVYNITTPSGESKTIKPYDVALSILIPLGEYFQVQDDFLDYSAPPEILGKIGTDIVDNKCSWCINTVLKVCSPEQRAVLERNYARKGDIEAGAEGSENDQKATGGSDAGGLCEKRVKDIYAQVGLPKIYADYEEGINKQLNDAIAAIPEEGSLTDEKGNRLEPTQGLKQKVFTSFLSKIYGRSK